MLALTELVLLGLLGGVLGAWIVVRGLAFFGHAAGTAAFPGVVAAETWGFPAVLGALAGGLGFAGANARPGGRHDTRTALALVAALALGAILFAVEHEEGEHAGEELLTGSLGGVSAGDVTLTAIVLVAALAANAALGRAWLASGFDGASRARTADRVLLVLVAAAVAVAVTTVGALLVSAALVLPAATARLLASRVAGLQLAAAAIAVAQAAATYLIASAFDIGPGSVLAVLAALSFVGVSLWRR